MSTLYLEWDDDFKQTSNGSVQLARGWDEVRQRIERRILTNAQFVQSDGTPVSADYYYHPEYGLSARARIGDDLNSDTISKIEQILYEGTIVDEAVDGNILPNITHQLLSTGEVLFSIGVTLASGQLGTINFTLP